MDSAGLRRIVEMCHDFGVAQIDQQLNHLEKILAEDEKSLREILNQAALQDYTNPQDVYNALMARTQGTKAYDYFLSTLQHLLLIREDGANLAHYYQIVDSAVTDIVLDKKLSGAESRLGTSVQRIIAQLNEAERFQFVEDQAAEARARALQLKLEKEALEEEISQGSDGLVKQLKDKVANLEEKLKSSRGMVESLQGRIDEQKRGYEERIAQLELQILELFRMLKEMGSGMEQIVEMGTSMDRKTLLANLEKQLHRERTINHLEGRRDSKRRRKRDLMPGGGHSLEGDGYESESKCVEVKKRTQTRFSNLSQNPGFSIHGCR